MFRLTLVVGFLFCITAQMIDLRNDEIEDEIPKQQKGLSKSRRSTKSLPTRITFKTDIGIAPNLYSQFSSKAEVDKYVGNLIKQANKLFSDPSLDTKMTIQVRKITKVNRNFPSSADAFRNSMKLFKRDNYHLGVLGLSDRSRSTKGWANLKSACRLSDHKHIFNSPFIRKPDDFFTDANFVLKVYPGEDSDAPLLAHEVGHVIGMRHNNNREWNCTWMGDGVMDHRVGGSNHKWSSCNNEQLREHYKDQGYLCL